MQSSISFHIGSIGSSRILKSVGGGKHSALLDAYGVKLINLEHAYPKPVQDLSIPYRTRQKMWRSEVTSDIKNLIDWAHDRVDILAITLFDDRFLGNEKGMLKHRCIYPRSLTNIRMIPGSIDNSTTTVSISLESYHKVFDRVITSRSNRKRVDKEVKPRNFIPLIRTWTDVIEDVKRHLPNSRLILWDMESYRIDKRRLEECFFGVYLDIIDDISSLTRTSKLHHRWLSSEIEYLEGAYERDILLLKSQYPDSFI